MPGVPGDARLRAEEFAVVFRLLDPTEQECTRIREAAAQEAAERRAAAVREAGAIRAGAEQAAIEAREAAAATVAASAPASAGRAEMAASVEDLRRRVRQRMPAVEAEVRRVLLEQLADIAEGRVATGGSGSRV